jgi:hypothetical protein
MRARARFRQPEQTRHEDDHGGEDGNWRDVGRPNPVHISEQRGNPLSVDSRAIEQDRQGAGDTCNPGCDPCDAPMMREPQEGQEKRHGGLKGHQQTDGDRRGDGLTALMEAIGQRCQQHQQTVDLPDGDGVLHGNRQEKPEDL